MVTVPAQQAVKSVLSHRSSKPRSHHGGNSLSGHLSQLYVELYRLHLSSYQVCLTQKPSEDNLISLKIQ